MRSCLNYLSMKNSFREIENCVELIVQMSAIEAEYQALRNKRDEGEESFKREFLALLEKHQKDPLSPEEENEYKEFTKSFFGEESLQEMSECIADLSQMTLSKELSKARAILNGDTLPPLHENEIETIEHYFTVTELKQMRPEVLAHHIKVLEDELAREPLCLTADMFGVEK